MICNYIRDMLFIWINIMDDGFLCIHRFPLNPLVRNIWNLASSSKRIRFDLVNRSVAKGIWFCMFAELCHKTYLDIKINHTLLQPTRGTWRFLNFSTHLSRPQHLEKYQNPMSFSNICLWTFLIKGVIFLNQKKTLIFYNFWGKFCHFSKSPLDSSTHGVPQ